MTPELNWLSDPTVFAVNRLDAHSDHVCYRTVQEAAQRHSSLRQPLDGILALCMEQLPGPAPGGFLARRSGSFGLWYHPCAGPY